MDINIYDEEAKEMHDIASRVKNAMDYKWGVFDGVLVDGISIVEENDGFDDLADMYRYQITVKMRAKV